MRGACGYPALAGCLRASGRASPLHSVRRLPRVAVTAFRSRSALRSMSPAGSSLRAALTPAPTGETRHWRLSPAGRLSQRVVAPRRKRSPWVAFPRGRLSRCSRITVACSTSRVASYGDCKMCLCSNNRLSVGCLRKESCPAGHARGLRFACCESVRCAVVCGLATGLLPVGPANEKKAFRLLDSDGSHDLGAHGHSCGEGDDGPKHPQGTDITCSCPGICRGRSAHSVLCRGLWRCLTWRSRDPAWYR